jgi:hypothetical protein
MRLLVNLVSDVVRQFQSANGEPEAQAPDALEVLHADHEEVAALFKTALDDAASSAAKKTAVAKEEESEMFDEARNVLGDKLP